MQTTPSAQRRGSLNQASSAGDETKDPYFPKSSNYFQNGSTLSSGNFPLSQNFDNIFYLKGKEVHSFIKDGHKEDIQCLISVFESSLVNRIFIMAAIPKSSVDPENRTQEFYYALEPNSVNNNQSLCQTPDIINLLGRLHPTKNLVFSSRAVCPNCTTNQLVSSLEVLLDQSGRSLKGSVNLDYLRLNLLMTTLDPSIPVSENNSCKSAPKCQSKGFDCCSFGQCVKDRQLKKSTDTSSSEYAQALADIQKDPNAIYRYPQFYHLCSTLVAQEDTDDAADDDGNSQEEARKRFLELERLYQCTTLQEGEMSLCTVSYSDVKNAVSNQFSTRPDDRNFNSIYSGKGLLPPHSIYKIVYAGETLFENNRIISGLTFGGQGVQSGFGGNDNLNDRQIVRIAHTASSTAPDDDLHITYKIDGSCERVNSTLARCSKKYIQGQNLGQVDDHFPASNTFVLPSYADLNRSMRVEVSGSIKAAETHWELTYVPRPGIRFVGDDLQVRDTQVVTINFYADLTSNPNLVFSKQIALEKIRDICECVDIRCRLKPKYDEKDRIVDYLCQYPQPRSIDPPLQEPIQLSSKTVPHLYYDNEGVYHAQRDKDIPEQEGKAFRYIKGDLLKPNNVDEYIGFNEIYGSFRPLEDSAQAAKEILVKKGRTYDILY